MSAYINSVKSLQFSCRKLEANDFPDTLWFTAMATNVDGCVTKVHFNLEPNERHSVLLEIGHEEQHVQLVAEYYEVGKQKMLYLNRHSGRVLTVNSGSTTLASFTLAKRDAEIRGDIGWYS